MSYTIQKDNNLEEAFCHNTSKTFVIQHPLVETKYLVHACLEGPEAGVYYRGNNQIDSGQTTKVITLPSYVSNIARNFTVHLTSIGQNSNIFTSSLVENNQFTVYGNPGQFYWIVYGTRNDLNIEIDKTTVTVGGKAPYQYLENLFYKQS